MIPAKMLSTREVAEFLGRSEDWVRRVANDRTKPAKQRKYDQTTHLNFPPMIRNGRTWQIYGPVLQRHLEKLSRKVR